MWGINTDHLLILTELNLEVTTTELKPILNYQEVNWEEFRTELKQELDKTATPASIQNQRQLDKCCAELTEALQEVIQT
jgi:hypothetical protein